MWEYEILLVDGQMLPIMGYSYKDALKRNDLTESMVKVVIWREYND